MSITRERKTELIQQFRRSEEDTGSPHVQIAVLTHRIITTFAAQAEGIDAKQIVQRLVEETEAEA